MVTPRWLNSRCQPIGIRDVMHYLMAVLDNDADPDGTRKAPPAAVVAEEIRKLIGKTVERDAALLEQHHEGDSRDRLGH